MDLQALRDRHRKLEGDWQKRLDDTKLHDHDDVQRINEKHKQADLMLVDVKDRIRESIQEFIERERSKVEEMHKADLLQKERQHTSNLSEQKKLLE